MRTPRQSVPFVIVLATLVAAPRMDGQIDQHTVAQQLLEQDVLERSKALDAASNIGMNADSELRAALITALDREVSVHAHRYEAGRRGEVLPDREDPEFIARLSRVVVALRDPRTIPALTGALGTGVLVSRALAAFGEQAAPAILNVVTSPQRWHEIVNGGLIALRFMVEGAREHPLSAGTLDQIRRAAAQRLAGNQRITTLWWAIDLAVALRDPGLRRIVESIASDPNEAAARGANDSELIARTQKLASDRLAGVPPLPRP